MLNPQKVIRLFHGQFFVGFLLDFLFHIRHPRIPVAMVVKVVQVPVRGLNQSVSQVLTISDKGIGSRIVKTMGNRFITFSLSIFRIGFLWVTGLVIGL